MGGYRVQIQHIHVEPSGAQPTEDNPWPVGMIFSMEGNGKFVPQVDPITHAAGEPHRFRVDGTDKHGSQKLTPVFALGMGDWETWPQRKKRALHQR